MRQFVRRLRAWFAEPLSWGDEWVVEGMAEIQKAAKTRHGHNAIGVEQRTICDACGNEALSHDRALWADDGASYCPPCWPKEPAAPLGTGESRHD